MKQKPKTLPVSDREANPALLSPEVMNEIRRTEIRTENKVDDLFAGTYPLIFKGRGIELDERAHIRRATMCASRLGM